MEKYTVEVFDNGTKYWYMNDKLHRADGPAIECADGSKVWYHNGKQHRVDGPAVEYADGSKEWYMNGKLHRTDGPAIEPTNGTKKWYIDGVKYTEREFNALTTKVVSSLDGKCIVIDGLEYRLVLVK